MNGVKVISAYIVIIEYRYFITLFFCQTPDFFVFFFLSFINSIILFFEYFVVDSVHNFLGAISIKICVATVICININLEKVWNKMVREVFVTAICIVIHRTSIIVAVEVQNFIHICFNCNWNFLISIKVLVTDSNATGIHELFKLNAFFPPRNKQMGHTHTHKYTHTKLQLQLSAYSAVTNTIDRIYDAMQTGKCPLIFPNWWSFRTFVEKMVHTFFGKFFRFNFSCARQCEIVLHRQAPDFQRLFIHLFVCWVDRLAGRSFVHSFCCCNSELFLFSRLQCYFMCNTWFPAADFQF